MGMIWITHSSPLSYMILCTIEAAPIGAIRLVKGAIGRQNPTLPHSVCGPVQGYISLDTKI